MTGFLIPIPAFEALEWRCTNVRVHTTTDVTDFAGIRLVVQRHEGDDRYGEPEHYWTWWLSEAPRSELFRKMLRDEGDASSETDARRAAYDAAVRFLDVVFTDLGGVRHE